MPNNDLNMTQDKRYLHNTMVAMASNLVIIAGKYVADTMDYLRMDGKQYASKVRNKALEDFDWLSQWLE